MAITVDSNVSQSSYVAWALNCISNLLLNLLAYRSLQVPRDALFELKPSPGKGWSAFSKISITGGEITAIFATREIAAGDEITFNYS